MRIKIPGTPTGEPIYWDWDDIRNEALELTAACKGQMDWTNFVGGETTFAGDDPIAIILEYNGNTAS